MSSNYTLGPVKEITKKILTIFSWDFKELSIFHSCSMAAEGTQDLMEGTPKYWRTVDPMS